MDYKDFSKVAGIYKTSKEHPFVLEVVLDNRNHLYEKYFTVPSWENDTPDLAPGLRKFLFENFGYSDMTVNGKCAAGQGRRWSYRIERTIGNAILYLCFQDKNDAMQFKLRWI